MYKEALKLIKKAEDYSNDPWNSWRPPENSHSYIFDFNKHWRKKLDGTLTVPYFFDSGRAGSRDQWDKALKAQDLRYNWRLSDKQNLANYQRSAKLHDINLKRRYQNKQIDWPYVYFGRNDGTKGLNWYTKPVGTDQYQLNNWNKINKPKSQQNWWQRLWN